MSAITIVGSYIVALVMDVERLPLEGETVLGRDYHTTHGGKGSNMAVCASRLGAPTRFFGKIGRDAFGDGFRDLLRVENVESDTLLSSEAAPTAVGFIISSKTGENMIVVDPAANAEFSVADVSARPQAIASSAVTLAPLEIPLATALSAAAIARAAGRKFILNPAPALDLREVSLDDVFALTPNEREARVCLGLRPDDAIPDDEIACRLLRLGVKHVMLTRGERGVLWASKEGVRAVPAPPVQVIDTVGAGDAFNAGLAVGLSEGKEILEAVVLGVTTASLSTQRRETIASYPYRPEVDQWLAKSTSAAASIPFQ